MGVQITRYKVTIWGNKETGERLFGVAAFSPNHGWMNVSDNRRAVLLDTKKQAAAYIAGMKRERDKNGFKKVAASI